MTDIRWQRAHALRALDADAAFTLLQPDGALTQLTGASADLARAVLDACAGQPMTSSELCTHVEALAGEPLENPSVVSQLLEVLARAGAVFSDGESPPPAPVPRVTPRRVLLGLTGAIQSAHAPALVQLLLSQGHTVRVMASESALRFVSAGALEAITHERVVTSLWPQPGQPAVPHMELALWAEALLIWPMSASTTSRIAAGDCSNLMSAVAITTRAPTLLAPSMNPLMLSAPSVMRNLETLRSDGFTLLPPGVAHEVAQPPHQRTPLLGGAPAPQHTALMFATFLSLQKQHHASMLPVDARSWDAFHAQSSDEKHAWFTREPDADITALLTTLLPGKGRLWDVGCGPGTLAIWACDRGFQVVASDVSGVAVERAQKRAAARDIVWLRDDVTRTGLKSAFDVVVDRGTLHVLPDSTHAAYAANIRANVKPGGFLVVKTHLPPGLPQVLSHPMDSETVVSLMGPGWKLHQRVEGAFGGLLNPAPPSVVTVLQRLAAS